MEVGINKYRSPSSSRTIDSTINNIFKALSLLLDPFK